MAGRTVSKLVQASGVVSIRICAECTAYMLSLIFIRAGGLISLSVTCVLTHKIRLNHPK
jgi:hypothetical protein